MYSPCCVTNIKTSGIEYINIEIEQFRDSFVVSCQNKQVQTTLPVQTLQNIIFENTVYKPGVMPLHAGGAEIGGKAFIFIAATGTGKTTLISYLSEKGYPYISDDKVLIDMDTLNVLIDIQPVHLRPESIPVLQSYGCKINGNEVNIGNSRRIVYTPKNVVSRDLPVGGLFFIERSESVNSCTNIPKAEAVQLLMQNQMIHDGHNSNYLKCAIKLADKCKRLVYSDMRYVAELLGGEK